MSEQLASPDDLRSIAQLCRSRDFELWAAKLEALADNLDRTRQMFHEMLDKAERLAADGRAERNEPAVQHALGVLRRAGYAITAPEDRRPHSRACGWKNHPHGRECASDCPTCRGGVA